MLGLQKSCTKAGERKPGGAGFPPQHWHFAVSLPGSMPQFPPSQMGMRNLFLRIFRGLNEQRSQLLTESVCFTEASLRSWHAHCPAGLLSQFPVSLYSPHSQCHLLRELILLGYEQSPLPMNPGLSFIPASGSKNENKILTILSPWE